MNVYDILNIKAPSDSIVNKNKRTSRARRIKGGAKDETKQEPQQDSKQEQPVEERKPETKEAPKQSRNITLQKVTENATVEKYDPVITRPIVSIYEYAEIHTLLAEYLQDQRTIAGFTNDVEIRSNVSPAEAAFYVLKEGKWDATIDRGYEKVSYSRLKYNPQWSSTIEHYFKQQHQIQKDELFHPLGLL